MERRLSPWISQVTWEQHLSYLVWCLTQTINSRCWGLNLDLSQNPVIFPLSLHFPYKLQKQEYKQESLFIIFHKPILSEDGKQTSTCCQPLNLYVQPDHFLRLRTRYWTVWWTSLPASPSGTQTQWVPNVFSETLFLLLCCLFPLRISQLMKGLSSVFP